MKTTCNHKARNRRPSSHWAKNKTHHLIYSTRLFLISIALSSIGATGCASTQPTSCAISETLYVHLHAEENLNPSMEGTSLPIVLRLYQLDQHNSHLFYDFDSLWDEPQKTFGNTLLETREWVLFPGSEKTETLDKAQGTKHLSLVGNFRTLSSDQWRTHITIPEKAPPSICAKKRDTKKAPDAHLHFYIRGYEIEGRLLFSQYTAPNTVLTKPFFSQTGSQLNTHVFPKKF